MELKPLFVAVLGAGIWAMSASAIAQTAKVEGIAIFAAGPIHPPNPVVGCNRAKQDALVQARTKDLVSWDRLSNDSDCALNILGSNYMFIARGNFRK